MSTRELVDQGSRVAATASKRPMNHGSTQGGGNSKGSTKATTKSKKHKSLVGKDDKREGKEEQELSSDDILTKTTDTTRTRGARKGKGKGIAT